MITFLAFLAASASEIFEAVTPYLGVVIPVVAAVLTKAQAKFGVKVSVALVLTVFVAVVSLASEPWDDVTLKLVTDRLLIVFGQAQLVYVALTALVRKTTEKRSLNEVEAFSPEKGLG